MGNSTYLKPFGHPQAQKTLRPHTPHSREACQQDCPVRQDGRRDHRHVAFAPLVEAEKDQGHSTTNKQANGPARAPSIRYPAPLQSQQDHEDGWNKHGNTGEVEALDTFLDSLVLNSSSGRVERQHQGCDSDRAQWKVDVENPTPRDVLCKRTSQQWAADERNTEVRRDDAGVESAQAESDNDCDDRECPRHQSCRTNSCDEPSDD